MSGTDMYERMAREMCALGPLRNATECRTKVKGLWADYRRVITHNEQTGNTPVICPFFQELHHIL